MNDNKRLRILHLVQDEKFTDCIISEFCFFNKMIDNHFVICGDDYNVNFKYLKQKDSVIHVSRNELNKYIREKKINVCILHNLRCASVVTLLRIPKSIKMVWFAWGADMYQTPTRNPFIKIDCYKPLTKSFLIQEKHGILEIVKNYIEEILLRILVRRVDFFSGCLPIEYNLMKNNMCFKAKALDFSYSRISDNPNADKHYSRVSGKNIIVGNSGDMSNNHLDIFEYLKKCDVNDRKIYVPLSYGGSKLYIDKVKEIGEKYFGNNFIALDTFVPIETYESIISSCSVCIYGHERQQALGNISMGIRTGCKVFLSKTSICYDFFTNIGCHIFSIQEDLTNKVISKELDENSYKHNIDVMQRERSPYVFYNKLKKIIGTFNNVID